MVLPPIGAFTKLGVTGALLAALLWLVHEMVSGVGAKVDSLTAEIGILADAVYDSCDAKRPRRASAAPPEP